MALSEDSNFPPRPFHRFIILYIFIFILKTHSSFQLIPFITLIFWQYIFSPEINQCSVSSSITLGRCHATSINTRRMLASQWLITFWSFGKSLEREAIIVKTFFSQWLCKNFWEGNLLLPSCFRGRAYDRHPVWSMTKSANTLLYILVLKRKNNNETRFKVVSVDICQKLSNLQKTLTSFAPAYRSRQLLRPGPLFFKSEWDHYIWSIFCPSECWFKLCIFQLSFWRLDRN